MRKITTTLADLDKLANQFGLTMPELVNLYSKPLPPVKHDSHVSCQMVGEWLTGYNSHVELWQETLDN